MLLYIFGILHANQNSHINLCFKSTGNELLGFQYSTDQIDKLM